MSFEDELEAAIQRHPSNYPDVKRNVGTWAVQSTDHMSEAERKRWCPCSAIPWPHRPLAWCPASTDGS